VQAASPLSSTPLVSKTGYLKKEKKEKRQGKKQKEGREKGRRKEERKKRSPNHYDTQR